MLAVGAVSFIGAPAIATAHARGDRVDLERVARHFSRLNLTFALPLAIVLVVAGERLLRLFGPDFVAGYWPLAMLVVVQLLSAGLGVQGGFLLTMTGRERMAGRIVAIGAVVNLLLTVVLTPTIGITGTALATLAATVLRIGWVVAAVRRELGVSLLR
jgi:O-antigen/teichoic acid export membrane protein